MTIELKCCDLEVKRGTPRVIGTIAWRLGEELFPDERWYDFPGVILAWWITALSESSRSGTKLRFMDGPLWLEVGPTRGGRVVVRGLKDRLETSPQVLTERYEVELDELRSLVIRAASQVLQFSRSRGINDRDVETLAGLVAQNMS